jgi:hypothetical protein
MEPGDHGAAEPQSNFRFLIFDFRWALFHMQYSTTRLSTKLQLHTEKGFEGDPIRGCVTV